METDIIKRINESGRVFYGSEDVARACPEPDGTVETFGLGRYVTAEELADEYLNRGLVPAGISGILALGDNVLDERRYVATQWKDSDGNWCSAAFYRWDVGRRVRVYRYDGGAWSDIWWFCGVRELGTKDTPPSSESLDLGTTADDVSEAIEMVKKAGYEVWRRM